MSIVGLCSSLPARGHPARDSAAEEVPEQLIPQWMESLDHPADLSPRQFVELLIRRAWRSAGERPQEISLPVQFETMLRAEEIYPPREPKTEFDRQYLKQAEAFRKRLEGRASSPMKIMGVTVRFEP